MARQSVHYFIFFWCPYFFPNVSSVVLFFLFRPSASPSKWLELKVPVQKDDFQSIFKRFSIDFQIVAKLPKNTGEQNDAMKKKKKKKKKNKEKKSEKTNENEPSGE